MAQVFLSLGTNINRDYHVSVGIQALAKSFSPLTLSSVYESEAVGFSGSNFYNMVIGFSTHLPLTRVAQICRDIEYTFGREKNAQKFSPRTLDLDILLFDDVISDVPVQIPRAEILTNAFVLKPLAEIAGDLIHPENEQSYTQLWHNYSNPNQTLHKVELSLSETF